MAERSWQHLVRRPVEDARAELTAAGVTFRVIGPGDMVTMDYRPERVNLYVEHDEVVRVTLG